MASKAQDSFVRYCVICRDNTTFTRIISDSLTGIAIESVLTPGQCSARCEKCRQNTITIMGIDEGKK